MCEESKRVIFGVFFSCVLSAGVLCGCTRREQLILDAGNTGRDARAADTADAAGRLAEDTDDMPGGTETGRGASDSESKSGPETEVSSAYGQADRERMTAGENGMTEPEEALSICVHVCGAVHNAGVYEMPSGSRVFEAVELAGGFTEEAVEGYVNQAQPLSDGAKLVIPTKEQVESLRAGVADGGEQIGISGQTEAGSTAGYGVAGGEDKGTDAAVSSTDGKININTASEEQLCEIPGIGATRAAAIVAYRQQAGGFSTIEDIMKVSGIKEGTYTRIKDNIKVE